MLSQTEQHVLGRPGPDAPNPVTTPCVMRDTGWGHCLEDEMGARLLPEALEMK